MLPTQAWIARSPRHDGPTERLFDAPSGGRGICKPRGGLWTSTWDPRSCSGWAQWCIEARFKKPPYAVWLLDVEPAARVFTVDTYYDLAVLMDAYGVPTRWGHEIAWGRLARDYDALHLTDAGQWATRLSEPHSLYGWDCESTVWMRWAFTDVRRFGDWSPPQVPCGENHESESCWRCDGSGVRWLTADGAEESVA